MKGACDIIAEMISDDAEMTALVREKTVSAGVIVTEAVDHEEQTVYEMYYEYKEGISKIPNHRVLAITEVKRKKSLE